MAIKKLHEYGVGEIADLAFDGEDSTLRAIYENSFFEEGDINTAQGTANNLQTIEMFSWLRYIFGFKRFPTDKEWHDERDAVHKEAGGEKEELWLSLDGLVQYDSDEYDEYGIPWPTPSGAEAREELRKIQYETIRPLPLALIIDPDVRSEAALPSPPVPEPEAEPERPEEEDEEEEEPEEGIFGKREEPGGIFEDDLELHIPAEEVKGRPYLIWMWHIEDEFWFVEPAEGYVFYNPGKQDDDLKREIPDEELDYRVVVGTEPDWEGEPEIDPGPETREDEEEPEPEKEPLTEEEKEELKLAAVSNPTEHPRLRITVTNGEYTLEYFEDPLGARAPIKTELNSEIKRLFGYSGWEEYKKENWGDLKKPVIRDEKGRVRSAPTYWPFHVTYALEEYIGHTTDKDYVAVFVKPGEELDEGIKKLVVSRINFIGTGGSGGSLQDAGLLGIAMFDPQEGLENKDVIYKAYKRNLNKLSGGKNILVMHQGGMWSDDEGDISAKPSYTIPFSGKKTFSFWAIPAR